MLKLNEGTVSCGRWFRTVNMMYPRYNDAIIQGFWSGVIGSWAMKTEGWLLIHELSGVLLSSSHMEDLSIN